MNNFSWITAFLVFIFYIFTDILYVLYTRYILHSRALATANTAAVLYGLFAFGTIQYVENHLYIIPVILGSWIGSYLTVKYVKDK